jgi:hypothetical protein
MARVRYDSLSDFVGMVWVPAFAGMTVLSVGV